MVICGAVSEGGWVVVLLVQVLAAMSPNASISVSVMPGVIEPGVSRSNQGMHGAVTQPR